MAKFQTEASDDSEYYIVESDNGTNRKYFRNEEEARSYYRYLQLLDDQHHVVEQNKQIIANQHRNAVQSQRVVQVLDPEYEEWLRFKKAKDPEFQQWKEEEERKIKERKELEIKRQKEMVQREIEKQLLKEIDTFKHHVEFFLRTYKSSMESYLRWWAIIEKLSQVGSNPIYDISLESIETLPSCHLWQNSISKFLNYKTEASHGFIELEKTYKEMLKKGLNKTFKTVDDEHSYWKSGFEMIQNHKCILSNIIEGKGNLLDYLNHLQSNLNTAKEWREWGMFGKDGQKRRKYHEYWERYQYIYNLLLSCIRSDYPWHNSTYFGINDIAHSLRKCTFFI